MKTTILAIIITIIVSVFLNRYLVHLELCHVDPCVGRADHHVIIKNKGAVGHGDVIAGFGGNANVDVNGGFVIVRVELDHVPPGDKGQKKKKKKVIIAIVMKILNKSKKTIEKDKSVESID